MECYGYFIIMMVVELIIVYGYFITEVKAAGLLMIAWKHKTRNTKNIFFVARIGEQMKSI